LSSTHEEGDGDKWHSRGWEKQGRRVDLAITPTNTGRRRSERERDKSYVTHINQ